MAFRNHRYSPVPPAPAKVVEQVLKHDMVDDVDVVSVVEVDASSTADALPSFDDYKLSALLNTGQPLREVDPVLYHSPENDAAKMVDELYKNAPIEENNGNIAAHGEDNTNVEPSNNE